VSVFDPISDRIGRGVLNIGSKTRRFMRPDLRISRPIIVIEWPYQRTSVMVLGRGMDIEAAKKGLLRTETYRDVESI
jgi:hypothetical protein